MVDEENFCSHFQFIQLLKHWLCNMWLDVVAEKNWAHSVDQSRLQALQLPVPLIDLLSILLRCSGFTGIQKAMVDQTGSRPPNSDHDLFFMQVWLWDVLQSFILGPATELVVSGCIKSTFCCIS